MKNVIKSTAAAVVMSLTSVTAPLADGHGWAPEGPITMMIAFAAGGGADTQARLIADDIQAATGWEIVPQQVTGAGGVNALVALQDMPADGTAIALVVTESLGYNAAAAPNSGITPDDFTGLTTTAGFQMAVVAKADRGWTSFEDMIAEAASGELRFGTMSPKLSDLAFLLAEAHGVEFNIVQVRGGRAVMDGVQAGDMDLGFMAGIQRRGVESGDLVNLVSALTTPLVQTPDVPTFADVGVEFAADGYFVFVGPGDMDSAAREAITAAIVEATTSGSAADMIGNAFGGAINIQGEELDALMAADYEAAGALMEAAQ